MDSLHGFIDHRAVRTRASIWIGWMGVAAAVFGCARACNGTTDEDFRRRHWLTPAEISQRLQDSLGQRVLHLPHTDMAFTRVQVTALEPKAAIKVSLKIGGGEAETFEATGIPFFDAASGTFFIDFIHFTDKSIETWKAKHQDADRDQVLALLKSHARWSVAPPKVKQAR